MRVLLQCRRIAQLKQTPNMREQRSVQYNKAVSTIHLSRRSQKISLSQNSLPSLFSFCLNVDSALEVRRKTATEGSGAGGESLYCSICKKKQPSTSFTNNQARKPDSARKCRDCCAKLDAAEAENCKAAREKKLADAQSAAAAAAKMPKGAAGTAARLKAASAECAAEAEQVTGLKPLVGAGKRGRGGRGRGTWRGRGSR